MPADEPGRNLSPNSFGARSRTEISEALCLAIPLTRDENNMIINKKQIRSLKRYTGHLVHGQEFRVGAFQTSNLQPLGFSPDWEEGETLLPPADRGPVAHRNAEGRFIIHTDQPKETAYREFEWTWNEWHGPYSVENSKTVYADYERYPRTFVPPTALEITTTTTSRGQRLVAVARSFKNGIDDDVALVAVNLILELFGEAVLLGRIGEEFVHLPLKRLNWRVLPVGAHPWQTLEPHVRAVLDQQGPRKRPVYERRWKEILDYGPDFGAVGQAGFTGYLVFGFTTRDLYILESVKYGNATYILECGLAESQSNDQGGDPQRRAPS